MIKMRPGCPICHSALYNGSGCSSDPKHYYTCENGHRWCEYTAIEIIDDKGEDEYPIGPEYYIYV